VATGAVLFYLSLLVLIVAYKWAVFGRLKTSATSLMKNEYIEYHNYQVYLYLLTAHILRQLQGTALANAVLRILGARVPWSVHIESVSFYDTDLLEIGDGSVLDTCWCLGHKLEFRDGAPTMVFAKCKTGAAVVLQPGSIVWAEDVIPDGVTLTARSQILSSTASDLCPNHVLSGVPAIAVPELQAAPVRVSARPPHHDAGGSSPETGIGLTTLGLQPSTDLKYANVPTDQQTAAQQDQQRAAQQDQQTAA